MENWEGEGINLRMENGVGGYVEVNEFYKSHKSHVFQSLTKSSKSSFMFLL